MTTITTDMLKFIAHTLGATVDYTQQVLSSEFDTDIDDTPADETEHDMGTMTITQEQFQAVANASGPDNVRWLLETAGITIAPPEPPEAARAVESLMECDGLADADEAAAAIRAIQERCK